MPIQSLPWGEMIVSALGGGGIAKAFDFIASRGQSKAYTMGAVDHAVQTAMQTVTSQLERTEKRLGTMENQHQECQEHLEEVRDKLTTAQREIDRLMLGPIAPWASQ